MKLLTIVTLFLALLGKAFAHDPATDMATAAQRFILSLDDKAKKEAVFSWKDKERERWHFVPGNFIKPNGKRLGLTLGNMKPAQRTRPCPARLRPESSWTLGGIHHHDPRTNPLEMEGATSGTLTSITFVFLENPMPPALGDGDSRDITSLNFTLVNGRIFSVTPSFGVPTRRKSRRSLQGIESTRGRRGQGPQIRAFPFPSAKKHGHLVRQSSKRHTHGTR